MSLALNILAAIGTLLLWSGAGAVLTFMPPVVGAMWMCTLLALFWYLVIRRAGNGTRYHVPLASALPRLPFSVLASTTVAVSAFYVAFQTYYFRLMPARPDATTAFDTYARKPFGWVATLLLIVLFLPALEEFVFRGWILRSIQRRAGTAVALGLSAILFSAFHLELWAAPFHIVSGLIYGVVALRTNSINAAVLVHVVANATGKAMGALAGPAASPDRWLDILRVPAEAQPVLAVCAVAALAGVLWRLGVRSDVTPSRAAEVTLGEG